MQYKIVAVRLPEKAYKELEERAKKLGFQLVSDYVRAIILKELGKAKPPLIEELEFRLTRIEEGEIPPKLYERIWKIVLSALEEEGVGKLSVEELKPILEKWLDTLTSRIDRRVQDLINPYTARVSEVLRRIAELHERIENLEERIKQIEERIREQKAPPRQLQPYQEKRKTGIERLKEQGVVFESELYRLRNRDAFFDYLARSGAKIIEAKGERIAVDPEFWEKFTIKLLEEISTSNEDEIKILLTKQEYKLFQKLKESGLLYYDSISKKWKLVEPIT